LTERHSNQERGLSARGESNNSFPLPRRGRASISVSEAAEQTANPVFKRKKSNKNLKMVDNVIANISGR
jgi:hypothetical protein